ncbi:MAG: GNAT family N-acetyltransferase [Caldilineaceae bacterium]|nr:GNAT family N-acetyltransferase [Caldilineaceae bacterium]
MSIAAATPADLNPVRRLLQTAAYCYLDIGAEDLSVLLAQTHSTLGQEQGKLWGFFGVQQEDRPATLPAAAPTRAYVRALAVQRPMRPGPALQALLGPVQEQLAGAVPGVQMICYGAEVWVHQTLTENGFAEVERVQFFELDRLPQRAAALPPGPPQVQITPGHPDYLADLARLDAGAFAPLWHFGPKDLLEMLMRCRVQLAWWEGVLAGYTAVCANSRSEAQLARLAVHPDYQGRGVGRTLLGDSISYAAQEFDRLVLNTQTTNQRSQKLYLGFGFRPIGLSVPVLVRTLQ